MPRIARARIAEQARTHLGEPAPENTCGSKGMNLWPQELDLPGIGTNSVSEAKARALNGYNGWTYSEHVEDAQPGDFLDWKPEILGDPRARHVSVLHDIDHNGWYRCIGAGGPSGVVAWQPASGGHNPPDHFRGFFRAPVVTVTTGPTPRTTGSTKTYPATYTVERGDYLLRIAARHGTTVGRIVALNKLRNPDHIEVGQVLKLR